MVFFRANSRRKGICQLNGQTRPMVFIFLLTLIKVSKGYMAFSPLSKSELWLCKFSTQISQITALLVGKSFLLCLLYMCLSPDLAAACGLLYSSNEMRTETCSSRFTPPSLHIASFCHFCEHSMGYFCYHLPDKCQQEVVAIFFFEKSDRGVLLEYFSSYY